MFQYMKIKGKMNKRHITVFDLDGTLTRDDTFISFSCHALGTLRVVVGILKTFPYLLRWKMGFISGSRAKQKLYSVLYKGLLKDEILKKSKDFRPDYRRNVLEALNKQKQTQDSVYIISASLDLWVKQIAYDLGVKYICTEVSIDNEGRLNGLFSSPNCHGEEKIRRLLEKEMMPFYLTVYGDEPQGGDFALFNMADICHVVETNNEERQDRENDIKS